MSTAISPDHATIRSVDGSGPSFAAALVGFLSTTVATTMLIVLISTIA